MTKNVAIFIFDEVEVLDFAGPFEVFAVAREIPGSDDRLHNVYTVSMDGETISARNALSVNPSYSIETMPQPDILLIPGGRGTRPLVHDEAVINFIREQSKKVELLLSVCTGALLLAKAGVLKDLSATTYHTEIDHLKQLDESITTCPGERWVDNGNIITSAGVSAGIDMSLHVLEKLYGRDKADETATYMEYEHWEQTVVS
ncbi:MAG: DJ-1/PfpI family protein [Aggregatilineales bacterium]